jgi:hypothetical protein
MAEDNENPAQTFEEGLNSAKEQPCIGEAKFLFNSAEFSTLVELNLWSRIMKRLWLFVGGFSVLGTFFGYIGVPYLIETTISEQLRDTTHEFEIRARSLHDHATLYAVLSVQYDEYLQAFRRDVIRASDILRTTVKEQDPNKRRELEDLMTLASLLEFQSIVTGNDYARRRLFSADATLGELQLTPAKRYVPPGDKTLSTKPHSVNDGSYNGILRDLKFRVAILASFKAGLVELENTILASGADALHTEAEKRARLRGLEDDVFWPVLEKNLGEIVDTFSTVEERNAFNENRNVYFQDLGLLRTSRRTN